MSLKDNKNWVPLSALIITSAVNLALVHYFISERVAKILDIDENGLYITLCTLILIMFIVRFINILKGQDWFTNRVNEYFDNNEKNNKNNK